MTRWDYYTPFIVLSAAVVTIGAGMLLTIDVNTPNWKIYGFTIIAGTGIGLSVQAVSISIGVLPRPIVPIGIAIAMFSRSLSVTIFLAISNSVLSNDLLTGIAKSIPTIDSTTIVNAGATGIRTVIIGDDMLALVLEAYNLAIRHVFIIAVVCGGASFAVSLGFEWKSVKAKDLAARKAQSSKSEKEGG
jgi:hypothetical protein